MSNIGVQEPNFEDLPGTYSPDVWDSAWLELEKAYAHAQIVYQLKDDENTFAEILKGLMGMTDGHPMASYNGHVFSIPAPTAQETAEGIAGGAGSRIAEIRTAVEEIHEQDRSDFEDWLRRMSNTLGDLEWNSTEAYLRGVIGTVVTDLGEDNWDSELAREVRSRAILKIERALTWVWNTTSFLNNHFMLYDGILLTTRQDIYSQVLEAVKGLKQIADDVERSMAFSITQVSDFAKELKAATAIKTDPIGSVEAVTNLVDMTKTTNEENGIAQPESVLEALSTQTGKSFDGFNQALDNAESQISELIQEIATTPLADLTLPEVESLF
ncbi:hypothetical protein [Glycomyces paridis]|uniref:Uncharacterized protein n=1 Tax=Glycomyces paridis TaxID=2126555 RepID=A0A4S8NYN3_9ACTN|nr:hypothetical protein [Glycomyces paridis]THV22041.1 hypothetical protein E9998_23765 [Glycomyces paridis]